MAKRKVRSSKRMTLSKQSYKWVVCSKCNFNEVKVSEEAIGAICSHCCQTMVEIPAILKKSAKTSDNKPRKPRGWQWMKEFVDKDGTVYHKGVEQPKLKGKKKPTVIEPKKPKSLFERNKEKQEKQAKLAKRYQKKQEKLNGKPKKRGRKPKK